MLTAEEESHGSSFLTGGGAMGALMRASDWSASPLGPPESWPLSLRSVVGLMLSSGFPMFIAWGDELALLYNDAYAEILGTKHPAALGCRLRDVWPEIWSDLKPLVDTAFAGEAVYRENLPLVVDGRGPHGQAWFTFSYSPVRDQSGAVVGMFCAVTETTKQVLVERRLAEERVRQQRLFEQAPGFISILNGPEHRFEFVNDAYKHHFGDRAYIGRSVRDIFPDLADQGFNDLLDEVFTSGERFIARGMPVRLRPTPNGPADDRYLDFIYEPVTDERGAVTGIFVEGYEVTEAHRAQVLLRESEERNRRIVEGVKDHAIFVTDGAGVIADWTPGAAAIFGWPADEIIGKSADVLFTPEDRAAGVPARELEKARTTGCANDERWHVRHDGSRFFANGSVRPLHDAFGGVAGFIKIARDETARRATETALQQSEERYRTLFENIDAAFCVVEVIFDNEGRPIDHRFVEVNPAFERQTGLANALGRRATEILPAHEQRWFDTYGRLVETGGSIRFEDGSEALGRWFDVHALRVGEPDQRRVAIMFNDISDRRRAELALRELNADLERKVAERVLSRGRTWQLSPEIMGIINPAGYFEESNPAWQTVLGWSAAEVASMIFLDFIHPDDLARTQAVWSDVTEHGQPALRFENRYRCKDGGWRWLSWVAVPEDGKVYCSARDVTDDKAAQAERDQLWTLSEDMLARADYAGTLSAVNPAWTKTLGWSEHKLLTEPYADIIHPDNFEIVGAAIEEMRRTGQPTRFENRIMTASGEWKPIGWTVAPEPDGGNFIAVGRDLTEDKARERELLEAQEALRQSQKMEAMGQLTGGVAHDFNNLLTPIIGSLDMLTRRGLGNERERRLIDGALQSAERAKTLVQRLLAFARRQPLQAVAVDLGDLVHGMAGLLGSTVGPSIELRVEIADDLPPAKADQNQLEMAILNLGVNARDAMPEGGVLTISATRKSVRAGYRSGLKLGHYVRLCVADTGVGMDEMTRARAVEPFFSTKGIGKGTGLGLSMVHGLIAQLGGGMTIISERGRGTTIELWLPISSEPIGIADGGVVAVLPDRTQGRALLVDDEELVRMSTADMLNDLGYEVVEAGSAEEALRLIRGGTRADVLITDHLMPGMSGAELAREIRLIQPGLPILIVSGYAEVDGIAPDLLRLTKPFRNSELAERLSTLLEARTAGE